MNKYRRYFRLEGESPTYADNLFPVVIHHGGGLYNDNGMNKAYKRGEVLFLDGVDYEKIVYTELNTWVYDHDLSWIDEKTEHDLLDLDDDPDLDDDRFLEQYRRQRLSELREAAKVARFGSVVPISGSDFIHEVSQAPPDVWVVVILYKDGIPECELLMQCLEYLATKYPGTKFVKIISTDCIPNYPDHNLPTLLVYNSGAVKANHVGMRSFGRRCTPEGICSLFLNALISYASSYLIGKACFGAVSVSV